MHPQGTSVIRASSGKVRFLSTETQARSQPRSRALGEREKLGGGRAKTLRNPAQRRNAGRKGRVGVGGDEFHHCNGF